MDPCPTQWQRGLSSSSVDVESGHFQHHLGLQKEFYVIILILLLKKFQRSHEASFYVFV